MGEHFLLRASNYCTWAMLTTPLWPLLGPGPLGKDVCQASPGFHHFWPHMPPEVSPQWAPVSRQAEHLPGAPGLPGELRAVMLEIPVREKSGAVAT